MAVWKMDGAIATCDRGTWKMQIEPARPSAFARFYRLDESWDFASIKALPDHRGEAEEIYSRGEDLITRFSQSDADAYSFALTWRSLDAGAGWDIGVELWLSVQTLLLDATPRLEISSGGTAGDWSLLQHAELESERAAGGECVDAPAAFILENRDDTETSATQPLTGLWLIEPSDQCHAHLLSSAQEPTQRISLFDHFMEKGVIRRARMRFLLSTSQVTRGEIRAAYDDFAASPLPLTA